MGAKRKPGEWQAPRHDKEGGFPVTYDTSGTYRYRFPTVAQQMAEFRADVGEEEGLAFLERISGHLEWDLTPVVFS